MQLLTKIADEMTHDRYDTLHFLCEVLVKKYIGEK